MTIAIGMLCRDGVVLGSDREHTAGKYSYESAKAHFLKRKSLQIGLVGAGTTDLISYAFQELERRTKDHQSAEEVRIVLEEVGLAVHQHQRNNTQQYVPTSLLVGIKTNTEIRLVKVADAAALWVDTYELIGSGKEMSRFVLQGLYRQAPETTCWHGMLLTIRGLKAAKQHVVDCGGPSDVLLLQRGFHVWQMPHDQVAEQEQYIDRFAEIMNQVQLAISNIEVRPPELDELLMKMQADLQSFRSEEFLRRQRERFERDLQVEIEPEKLSISGHVPTVRVEPARSDVSPSGIDPIRWTG